MMTEENTTTDKKPAKTRTSITVDPEVLEAIKKLAESTNVSVSSIIEDALRAKLGS